MRLLTFTEVCARLGVSLPTGRRLRAQLSGVVLVNQRVKYREDLLQDFIARGGCRYGSESGAELS
jgi:hypothetical protein